jgi:hypothetical protein
VVYYLIIKPRARCTHIKKIYHGQGKIDWAIKEKLEIFEWNG